MQHDPLTLTPFDPRATLQRETDPTPDSVLLERIAAGEKQALTALLTRHGPRLYELARKILPDPAKAAAVVMEVSQEVRYETRWFSPSHYPVHRWLSDLTRIVAQHQLRQHSGSPAA